VRRSYLEAQRAAATPTRTTRSSPSPDDISLFEGHRPQPPEADRSPRARGRGAARGRRAPPV